LHYIAGFSGVLFLIAVLLSHIACGPSLKTSAKRLNQDLYLFEESVLSNEKSFDIKHVIGDIVSRMDNGDRYRPLYISNPYDQSVFPLDMASPEIIWEDEFPRSSMWLIRIRFAGKEKSIYFLTGQKRWQPDRRVWETIKEHSIEKKAAITIVGIDPKNSFEVSTKGRLSISTARERVDASIFYQHMPLPFAYAQRHPELSRWLLGDVSSYENPPVVMKELPVCGNCHSFSRGGRVLGMDMDYNRDKGAYLLTPVKRQILLTESDFITWNDFRRWDNARSMGLFSSISPDGDYVISTVKEKSFFALIDDLDFSQFFFPIKGFIAYYSRKEKAFFSLPGADDPDYVQTCPTWSPDGKFIVFSRAKVDKRLVDAMGDRRVLETGPDVRIDDLNRKYQIRFDLYRLPFNNGKGGMPEPVIGASNNGKSNYFPRYSPDGKWIVFTQAETGLAIQPESKLHIIPAQGGVAKKMRCNRDIMNSWHSWSPNSRWLVFTSKINTPFTELFLTHVDENGGDSPPVLLSRFNSRGYASIVPEFVSLKREDFQEMKLAATDHMLHGERSIETGR
jgi:hypothetical protein